MATTTNFGWTTPNDTDLVKDGAAAIRTLGSSIDTSFVDLKGGTTGQVLAKATATDLDFSWVTNAGDIEGVTAGTGLSGGGTSGTVTLSINTAVTADLTSSQTLTNKAFTSPEENITISATAATGTVNFDFVTQGILYYTTNASANFTLNFRGNSGATLDSLMSVGQSISAVFLNTNGATAYYASAFQVDGSSVTPKWSGGTASGSANKVDIIGFSFIYTNSGIPTQVLGQINSFN